jgi:hypothetical protein
MDEAPAPAAPLPPPDEPLGVGELLTAGTTVTLDNAGVIFGVWAVCGLPPQLLRQVLVARAGLESRDALRAALESRDWSVLGPLAAVGAVGLTLGVLGHATTLLVTANAHKGRPLPLGDALLGGAERAASVVGASVVTAGASFAGTLALVLPGLYLLVRLSLAACAAVVEEKGPFAAVSRSWALTAGRFSEVVVRMTAFVVLAAFGTVLLIFGGTILGVLASLAGPPGTILARLVVNAFYFVLTAWVAACVTKLYLDLASRRPA